MNLVVLVGNLTRDPEVRYAGNGNPVAHINIAVNKTFKREGGADADFFRVTVFGKQAELVERYLTKGRKVGIEGRIENSNYEDKNGQMVYRDSIIANRIEFLSSRNEGGSSSSGQWPDSEQSPFGGQFGETAKQPAATAPATAPEQSGSQALPEGFSALDDDDDDLPF